MQPKIIDGSAYAKLVQADLVTRVQHIVATSGVTPRLATIIVGDNPASVTYVNMKHNSCLRVGIEPMKIELPESTTTDELLAAIDKLNRDDTVFGILLQHPCPKHLDELRCFDAIALEKDVDGVTTVGFGAMTMGKQAFYPATPYAILSLLRHYDIPIEGKNAVVIGRSQILGKPVAMMLLNANATVTICHTKTQNLPDIVRSADIVVAAVGRVHFVQPDWIKPGAVLMDAGYNEGHVGDIDPAAFEKSSAYTPVPGGIGPVTRIKLIEQTVEAAERKLLK